MKTKEKYVTAAITLAAVFVLAATRPCAAQPPAPTNLGVLDSYPYNLAGGIDGSGVVVGESINFGANGYLTTATGWQPGAIMPTALPLLSGESYSEISLSGGASPINAAGLIAGSCYHFTADEYNKAGQACIWQLTNGDWTVTGLGFLPDTGYDYSESYAMNASGQVVGDCGNGDDWAGFIWDSVNGMQPFTNLPTVEGSPSLTLIPDAGISDNGYVAGPLRSTDGYNLGGVIWDAATKTTLAYLQYGNPRAISPSGLVAGQDSDAAGAFLFLWNYNNGSTTEYNLGQPPATPPADFSASDLTGMDIWPTAINDNGQIVGYGYAYWNTNTSTDLYWMWDGTQFVDLTTVLPADLPEIDDIQASLNASGQVALDVTFDDDTEAAYLWDGNPSDEAVALAGLGGSSMVVSINDAGQLAGGAFVPDDSQYHACVWGLSAPVSALDITDVTATSPNFHSPNITVTVTIANPGTTDTAYDVTVTSATLDGVDSNSALPLVYGAIKPGASKQCKLHFKNVPSGEQTLTINGTSSLGDFFISQSVNVP